MQTEPEGVNRIQVVHMGSNREILRTQLTNNRVHRSRKYWLTITSSRDMQYGVG
jgi:hypothetical protein